MKKILSAIFATAIISLLGVSTARSQYPTTGELREDITSLTTLDPDVAKLLPRWRILEADLKIKIAQVFKLKGLMVNESDSMIITATFPKNNTGEQEILTLSAGSSATLNGSRAIKDELGEGFYEKLLSRDYAYSAIEPELPITKGVTERIANVMHPPNAKQFIALSAFNQALQIGTTRVRLDHRIGTDEVGYHFWSSGQGNVMISYPIIPLDNPTLRANGVSDVLTMSLGGAYRLKFGEDGNNLGGVASARRINGALGFKPMGHIEFRFPDAINFGLMSHLEVAGKASGYKEAAATNPAFVLFNESVVRPGKLPQKDTTIPIRGAYFMGNVAQLTAFYEDWFNEYEHFVRFTFGVSYQDIQHAAVWGSNKAGRDTIATDAITTVKGFQYIGLSHPTDFKDWLYLKAEYLNQSGFPFGASVQLANRNLMLSGFVPLFPNWLFLEVKYATPVLRDKGVSAPWESSGFVMFSPILRIQLD